MNRIDGWIAGLCAALLLVAPLLLNAYWVDVLNSVGLYALLALGLNLILGEAGLFNMGPVSYTHLDVYKRQR